MPSPTPPEKVLAAARRFAREKFGDQHRYAMVLHTDQRHPHVHMVVKAESEEGPRLHIDKAMLRVWREDFARSIDRASVERLMSYASASRRLLSSSVSRASTKIRHAAGYSKRARRLCTPGGTLQTPSTFRAKLCSQEKYGALRGISRSLRPTMKS